MAYYRIPDASERKRRAEMIKTVAKAASLKTRVVPARTDPSLAPAV
jgi:hypothetical protein